MDYNLDLEDEACKEKRQRMHDYKTASKDSSLKMFKQGLRLQAINELDICMYAQVNSGGQVEREEIGTTKG